MKKNGVFCIAIAVALLVGGVGAVSASDQDASISQSISEFQGAGCFNAIVIGDVNAGDDIDISGNTLQQDVSCSNSQYMYKDLCAGIVQVGDETDTGWIEICSDYGWW